MDQVRPVLDLLLPQTARRRPYACRVGVNVAALEAASGTEQGDEVGCVHAPPPLLGELDEAFATWAIL